MKPLAGHRVAMLGAMQDRPLARYLRRWGQSLANGSRMPRS